MEPRELLTFLSAIAPLKEIPRHCMTPGGIKETVAAHSWRLATMAMLIADEFQGLDMDKVVRMCLVHDIGEAVTKDIPSFQKTKSDEAVEDEAIFSLLSTFGERERTKLELLFAEMDARKTPEARLYKALDKLEAVIAHNESDLKTWIPLERELNLTYATEEAAEFPFLKQLRELMLQDTMEKLAREEDR